MSPKASASKQKAERDRINRLLMKVEVYLNYKLHKQAKAALDELFAIDPGNLAAHEWQLRVYEMTGQKSEVAKQLVRLAALAQDDVVRANELLGRARLEGDEDALRAFAATVGIKVSSVFRLVGNKDEVDIPEVWPFVPDELCRRAVVVRRLADPDELRVDFAKPDGDDETLAPIALPLLRMALAVPTHERRAVVFFGEPHAYVVFVDGPFAAVHEYEPVALGRVMGRVQRAADGETA